MPINNICKQCNAEFSVEDSDLEFYKKMSPKFGEKTFEIPSPTLCPDCRRQRRISFRNERELYKRKCNLTGADIISMYPADVPFPVYHITEWFSDKWDPKSYGQEFDFTRPFFDQFKELSDKVPRFHAFVDPTASENSEYTNQTIGVKNCYLVYVAVNSENCFYSRAINFCKDCCDCLRVNYSELCYECQNVNNSYHSFYLRYCGDCSDCYFSTNLQGCRNCFGCHNLNQKQYYIYNKQVDKDEWDEFEKSLDFKAESIEKYQAKSEQIRLSVPHKFAQILQSEDCTGDHIYRSKNSHDCFDSVELENCAYCNEIILGAKDSYDFSMAGKESDLIYEAMGCGYSANNSMFLVNCRQNIANLIYCESCFPQVKNCFGCISLKNAEYCILNKQYSREDYERTVAKIIDHMQKTGEWGEFFPASLSPFRYNKTLANDYFPADRTDAEKLGMSWQESDTMEFEGESYVLKASIEEYAKSTLESEKLLSGVIKCSISGRPFKIMPRELEFYIKNKLPVPTIHYDERYKRRFGYQNPCKLFHRQCMCEESTHDHTARCTNEFDTTYSPNCPEKVFCETCYQKSVI